jgi:hypothetical protein
VTSQARAKQHLISCQVAKRGRARNALADQHLTTYQLGCKIEA